MLTELQLKAEGWEYSHTNGIRKWYTKPCPGRIHPNYGHRFGTLTMIYDFVDRSCRIESSLEDKIFDGIILSIHDLKSMMDLTNISGKHKEDIL